MRVRWYGDEIKRQLDRHSQLALLDAAEHLLGEANQTVPIEEGVLAGSGATDVDDETATVSYDTPYAVRLHENPQYRFQHGRRGKWLELTFAEQQTNVAEWLARRLRQAF